MRRQKTDWDTLPPEQVARIRWEIELYEAMVRLSDCPFRKAKATSWLLQLTGEEHYRLDLVHHGIALGACPRKQHDVHCLLRNYAHGINAAGHRILNEIQDRKPGSTKRRELTRSDP